MNSSLSRYVEQIHKQPMLNCPVDTCPGTFETQKMTQEHLDEYHPQTRPLVCFFANCSSTFHDISRYKKHIKNADHGLVPKTACRRCGRMLSSTRLDNRRKHDRECAARHRSSSATPGHQLSQGSMANTPQNGFPSIPSEASRAQAQAVPVEPSIAGPSTSNNLYPPGFLPDLVMSEGTELPDYDFFQAGLDGVTSETYPSTILAPSPAQTPHYSQHLTPHDNNWNSQISAAGDGLYLSGGMPGGTPGPYYGHHPNQAIPPQGPADLPMFYQATSPSSMISPTILDMSTPADFLPTQESTACYGHHPSQAISPQGPAGLATFSQTTPHPPVISPTILNTPTPADFPPDTQEWTSLFPLRREQTTSYWSSASLPSGASFDRSHV